jgi:hypothetical protein
VIVIVKGDRDREGDAERVIVKGDREGDAERVIVRRS